MITRLIVRILVLGIVFFAILLSAGAAFGADSVKGMVICGAAPIAKSTVTLWEGRRRRTQTARSNEVKRRWSLRGSR